MERYVVLIQNPRYANEVLIWDRLDREVVLSVPYRGGNADDQARAKRVCEERLREHLMKGGGI